MAAGAPIRARASVRLAVFLRRWTPLAVWLGAVVVCAALLRPTGVIGERGYAELSEASLGPVEPGLVSTVAVSLHEPVRLGQTLVVLDDTELQAELAEVRARIGALEARVEAERARVRAETVRIEQDEGVLASRLQSELARANLEVLDREASLAADRASLVGAEAELEILERAELSASVSGRELVAARGSVQRLREAIAGGEAALMGARQAYADADAQWGTHLADPAYEPAYDAVLAPVRAETEVERRRLDRLTYAIERAVIRAPFDGQVLAVEAFEGAAVQAGQTLVRMAPAETSRVVVYLDPAQASSVRPGDRALLTVEREPGTRYEAQVVSVADAVRRAPERHWKRVGEPRWGVEVVVAAPAGLALLPGEACGVKLGG